METGLFGTRCAIVRTRVARADWLLMLRLRLKRFALVETLGGAPWCLAVGVRCSVFVSRRLRLISVQPYVLVWRSEILLCTDGWSR